MLSRDLSFTEVMDVYAFRVITHSEPHCYMALGAVHALYQPKPGRFKDYIALPKANGYQSLHTVLNSPYGLPVEIQIRTEEMDVMAEKGAAAHWQYKSGETTERLGAGAGTRVADATGGRTAPHRRLHGVSRRRQIRPVSG